jgi:hypothetical protein
MVMIMMLVVVAPHGCVKVRVPFTIQNRKEKPWYTPLIKENQKIRNHAKKKI